MQICRVVGTVVSTQKNKKLEGAKLMLVQPLTLEDTPRGTTLLAIDSVGAGIGEKVSRARRPATRSARRPPRSTRPSSASSTRSRSGHERRRAESAGA